MKVLLTGANGFVGSHILDELIEHGFETSILIRKTSHTGFIGNHIDNVPVHYGSLDDKAAVAQAVTGTDAIVHCAAKTKVLHTSEFHEVNVIGTQNIVQAATDTRHLLQFVFISTLGVSGPGTIEHPSLETDPPNPLSPYSKSKAEGEVIVRSMTAPWTILRLAAVYGPRDTDFLQAFRTIRRGLIPLPGGRDQTMNLVYGRDVAIAVRRSLGNSNAFGKTYHIAAEPPYSAKRMADAIADSMNTRGARKVSIPSPVLYAACILQEGISRLTKRPHVLTRQKLPELRARGWVCSTELAKKDIGFTAPTALPEGLAKTADWYRQEGML